MSDTAQPLSRRRRVRLKDVDAALKLPVFVSAPSNLSESQRRVYDYICSVLDEERLQPRTLGHSDYPRTDPITEAFYIARACYGGVILGFSQMEFENGVAKKGTPREQRIRRATLPTPWNQIETGLLVALQRPLVVFAEALVEGGVFDQGAYSGISHRFTTDRFGEQSQLAIREEVRTWAEQVRTFYRSR